MRRPTRRSPPRGAAAVEFAIVAPVMLGLLFGMVEVGQMIMIGQETVNASRAGARLAVRADLPLTTFQDVRNHVEQYMTGLGVPQSAITITITYQNDANAEAQDPPTPDPATFTTAVMSHEIEDDVKSKRPIRVQVEVNYLAQGVAWSPVNYMTLLRMIGGDNSAQDPVSNLHGETIMRRE